MKLDDFPAEAREMLKNASHHELRMLGAEAGGERHRERMAELSTDPAEAIQASYEIRRNDLSVKVDDPLEFIAGSIELVRTIVGYEMDEDITHRAMWDTLTAAHDLLRDYRQRESEAQEHLRAAWLKIRDDGWPDYSARNTSANNAAERGK